MAYNNGYFPAGYGGYTNPYMQYQQPQMPAPTQSVQQQQNNGIQWVQGESGAKAFNVLPGQSVLLMDSENNTFYIKSTDASGMPLPLRIFDYTERTAQGSVSKATQQPAQIDTSKFVTHSELEERLAALIQPVSTPKKPTNRKTESDG